ncbi:MAG: MFS transporter [candidate division Zixibacteria bacterium]|nr:MFS transporter [candidate division Zixibacteria bacterium]
MNNFATKSKLSTASWAFYDFANTIFSMNIVTMYFAQWIIVDNKKEDIYYSTSYALSMFLVAITMPVLGAISDVKGKRKPFLLTLTLGCIFSTILIGMISNNVVDINTKIFLALAFFVVANFCYEGGLVFYNALLPEVSTKDNIGKVSGLGVSLGYVGAIVGLLLIKPFVEGNLFGMKIPFTSDGGREKAFIPTALFFLLFSLPIFLRVKEKVRESFDKLKIPPFDRLRVVSEVEPPEAGEKVKIKMAFLRVWEGISNTQKYPGVLRFLIANFFLADAIATVSIFMAVYAQLVMGFPDSAKIWFFIVSSTSAVIGSFLCGYVTDFIGPKKTLFFVIIGWILSLSVVMFIADKTIFWIMGSLVGIFLGSTWTASRPLLTSLAPKEVLGQFFGLYSLSGKAAAILGPILWGGMTLYFKADKVIVQNVISFLRNLGVTFTDQVISTIQYRFAVGALVLMMILGLIIFIKVPDRFKTAHAEL